jgi:hypothetical protein
MNRDLYLTKRSTHRRQTSMPPAIFETVIEAIEWRQAHASGRAFTSIGKK